MKIKTIFITVNTNINLIIAPLSFFVLIVAFSLLSPHFLSLSNFLNIGGQAAINIIISVGMTIVILSGGIDLSVGSLVAVAMTTMSQLHFVFGMNIWMASVIAIIFVTLMGAFSGFSISHGKIPPFIATLGMMGIARGIALVITKGYPSKGFEGSFRWLGWGNIFGIPAMFVIAIVIIIIGFLILKYTEIGRYFFAVGGNEEAARFTGIKIENVKIIAYAISGFCCGIAGIILASRINSTPPNAGTGYELTAIAAVVIGGASLAGGEGSITGTLLGALIMAVISNGLNLLNVYPFIQTALIGALIMIMVFVKNIGEKRNSL